MRAGKNFILIVSAVAISLMSLIFVYIYFEVVLAKTINSSEDRTHVEVMLWRSLGYSNEPQLNFYKFNIVPDPNNIRVSYRIENTSDKVIPIENDIGIEVLEGDQKERGEAGKSVWKWSQNYGERKDDSTIVAPGEVYQEEIIINREEAPVSDQYYINAYYKQEFVAQYKIIEGVYK